MNKMQLLNVMQRSTEQTKTGYWTLKVNGTHKTVSNIVKTKKGSYAVTVSGNQFKTFMGALASLITQYAHTSGEYRTTQTYYFCGVSAVLHGYNPQSQTFSHYELFRNSQQNTENRFLFSAPIEGKRLSAIDALEQVQECAANSNTDRLLYAKFEALFAGLI